MSTEVTKVEENKTERKDIYTGYSGTWAEGGLETKTAKNGKPYVTAMLNLGEDRSVKVTAFGDEQIGKLKEAMSDGVGTVHGYLSGNGINFHEAGDRTFKGTIANLRGGVSEKGVAWADAILKSENEDGKKFNHVVKAFGVSADIINEAGDGAAVTVSGHLTREKTKDDYRSGIATKEVLSAEPAPKQEKETESPSM